MNAPATIQNGNSKALTPIKEFQQQVEQREEAFASSLPAHIPAERFKRVVLRAVQKDPNLLSADRVSLLSAAMDAANDGLMPDGREAAMVIYNTKVNGQFIKKVQYMPMIFGILKKIRNSGELKSIAVRMVYGGDAFRYWIDENGEHIQYEAADNPDKTIFRRAFAIALTKDDGRYIEVMDAEDIEKVRSISRAKDRGPWVDWWEEMAKKTVLRRLAKRLPMSTDLDDLMRRDDALYNFDEAKTRHQVETPRELHGRLDALADMRSGDDGHTIDHEDVDEESDPTLTDEADASDPNTDSAAATPQAAEEPSPGEDSSSDPGDGEPIAAARQRGIEARGKGISRKAVPADLRSDEKLLEAYLEGFDG